MSPESLSSKKYSEKSDVWSFGVLCWEVINRSQPYPNLDPVLVTHKVMSGELHPDLPSQPQFTKVAKVMEAAFKMNPDGNPNLT